MYRCPSGHRLKNAEFCGQLSRATKDTVNRMKGVVEIGDRRSPEPSFSNRHNNMANICEESQDPESECVIRSLHEDSSETCTETETTTDRHTFEELTVSMQPNLTDLQCNAGAQQQLDWFLVIMTWIVWSEAVSDLSS